MGSRTRNKVERFFLIFAAFVVAVLLVDGIVHSLAHASKPESPYVAAGNGKSETVTITLPRMSVPDSEVIGPGIAGTTDVAVLGWLDKWVSNGNSYGGYGWAQVISDTVSTTSQPLAPQKGAQISILIPAGGTQTKSTATVSLEVWPMTVKRAGVDICSVPEKTEEQLPVGLRIDVVLVDPAVNGVLVLIQNGKNPVLAWMGGVWINNVIFPPDDPNVCP